MIYKCINCKKKIYKKEELYKECSNCNFINYKINNVPIIVENPKDYISNKLIAFSLYINNLDKILLSFEQNEKLNDRNSKVIKILGEKIEFVKSIRKELIPFCDIENLLEKSFDFKSQGYDISYEYLLRDWGNFKESEEEISIIYKHIKSKLNATNDSNVLVLGAALGRLAVELLKDFKNVFAIDLSYEMPSMLNKIINFPFEFEFLIFKNTSFSDKNYINCRIESSKIIEVAGGEEQLDRLNYFVSNVTNLPFGDETMDTIISCYFTDIIPIDEYFSEINRALKRDGIFIHFGPLDYHFENQNKMLTLKELVIYFEQRGYIVDIYEPVILEHISIPIKGVKKIYDNWFFKAQKKSFLHKKINYNNVLKINKSLDFEIIGYLQNEMDSVNIQKVNIKTSLGNEYECTIDTIRFLEKIDGKRKLDDIFGELEDDFILDEETKKTILLVLEELIKNQTLSKVK